MRTIVITPPTASLLDVATVRSQLSIGTNVSDATVTALVAAATSPLDGPDGWYGKALRTQVLELQIDRLPICSTACIRLGYPPIKNIVSVTFVDPSGNNQVLDPSLYTFDGERSIYAAYGFDWPAGLCRPNGVRVRYNAGYDTGAVPAAILQAIALQVAALNAMTRGDPSLTSETVPGVLSRSWSSADISEMYDKAAMRLLGPRVFA